MMRKHEIILCFMQMLSAEINTGSCCWCLTKPWQQVLGSPEKGALGAHASQQEKGTVCVSKYSLE